jgi:hypothetical protein
MSLCWLVNLYTYLSFVLCKVFYSFVPFVVIMRTQKRMLPLLPLLMLLLSTSRPLRRQMWYLSRQRLLSKRPLLVLPNA